MSAISQNDIQILTRYKFIENGRNKQNSHLLGLKWVKEGSKWRQELVEVSRQDVTCWNSFLSVFGRGKLKHITVSLYEISSHLSKYQWKEIRSTIGQEPFMTVCQIANRTIGRQLFKAVSEHIQGDFNHYWNPAMNGRFLRRLQNYRLPEARGVDLRFKDTRKQIQPYQPLTKQEMDNIEVGYEYELITEERTESSYDVDGEVTETTTTIYYYHYPASPYYSTDAKLKLLPDRTKLAKYIEPINLKKTLTTNDLQVLSKYNFKEDDNNKQNPYLLGLNWIKEGDAWRQELIEVCRQDVTCWNSFLSLFRKGKLKHVTVSLDKICSYLTQYKWKEIKSTFSQNTEDPMYKALKTVCHLANRHLRHQLVLAVSDPMKGDFDHYWNPAMNGRTLLRLQRYCLHNTRGEELRFKDSKKPVQPYQMLTQEDIGNIEVGYEYEQFSNGDDHHHYHYPHPPYYSTTSQTNWRPIRIEI